MKSRNPAALPAMMRSAGRMQNKKFKRSDEHKHPDYLEEEILSDREKVAKLRGALYRVVFAIDNQDLDELYSIGPELEEVLDQTADQSKQKESK